jgi:hypothetical protein
MPGREKPEPQNFFERLKGSLYPRHPLVDEPILSSEDPYNTIFIPLREVHTWYRVGDAKRINQRGYVHPTPEQEEDIYLLIAQAAEKSGLKMLSENVDHGVHVERDRSGYFVTINHRSAEDKGIQVSKKIFMTKEQRLRAFQDELPKIDFDKIAKGLANFFEDRHIPALGHSPEIEHDRFQEIIYVHFVSNDKLTEMNPTEFETHQAQVLKVINEYLGKNNLTLADLTTGSPKYPIDPLKKGPAYWWHNRLALHLPTRAILWRTRSPNLNDRKQ